MFFDPKISETGHARAMTCARCGPSNHNLQQRYRVLPLWFFVGIPFNLHYVWECQSCKQIIACDAATLKRLAPEFKRPLWHIKPLGFLKTIAAISLTLLAVLMLWFSFRPSRLERMEPQLSQIAVGQMLTLEWTQISPPIVIDRATEFSGAAQFGRAKIIAMDKDLITLQSPPWIFENGFRAIIHDKDEYTSGDSKKANKHAFRNLRGDQTVQITRARLRELLVQDHLLVIESAPNL